MKSIAFYISTHGYGHASRCVPIIEEMLKQDPNLMITVKTDATLARYMRGYLSSDRSRLRFVSIRTDVGLILKPGTMEVDAEALLIEVKQFVQTWDRQIEEEKAWLLENGIKLIITDIVPWF